MSTNRGVRYRVAQSERETAYANYNYASARLTLAYVYERSAELGSQAFEFVGAGKLCGGVGNISDREREIGLAFVRYAVMGRTDKEA